MNRRRRHGRETAQHHASGPRVATRAEASRRRPSSNAAVSGGRTSRDRTSIAWSARRPPLTTPTRGPPTHDHATPPRPAVSRSSARGTSVCRCRCVPWRRVSTWSGSTSTPGRVAALARGESFIDDVGDDELAAMLATGRFHPTADAADLAGFDVAVVSVPTPLRDGAPDLRYIEDAAEHARASRPRRQLRDPRVDHLSRHDRGGVHPAAREGSGLRAGRRLRRRLQPGADRPEQRDVELPQHPEDRVRRRRRRRSTPSTAFYSALVDTTVRVGRGARRPSWPSCWRTRSATSTSPWSTSWRCTPTSSASTCGT